LFGGSFFLRCAGQIMRLYDKQRGRIINSDRGCSPSRWPVDRPQGTLHRERHSLLLRVRRQNLSPLAVESLHLDYRNALSRFSFLHSLRVGIPGSRLCAAAWSWFPFFPPPDRDSCFIRRSGHSPRSRRRSAGKCRQSHSTNARCAPTGRPDLRRAKFSRYDRRKRSFASARFDRRSPNDANDVRSTLGTEAAARNCRRMGPHPWSCRTRHCCFFSERILHR